MMAYVRHHRRGFGDAAQGVQLGASLGTPVLTGALASSAASTAAATGSAATILGMAPTLAIPIIGAGIAAATMAIVYLIHNSGCGQTCIETSQWANQAEPLLKQNADAYFALPAPRTQSQQQAALNNFNVVWARLQQLCGQPGTGNAGVRCISDRQAGSCKWNATSNSPWPGGPMQGQCWNWWSAYHDPIAADAVVPDSMASTVTGAVSSAAASLNVSPWLLVAGAALIAVGVLS